MWVPSGIDWELAGKTGCERTKENWNRSGLVECLANESG